MSAVMTVRLTGESLLAYVNDHKDAPKTELVLGAGYVRGDDKPAFIDFYTELLKAKEVLDPNFISKRDAEDAEYDALSGTQQDLYDAVHNKLGEKWDHEMIVDFMGELDDLGIETPEQLDNAYSYQSESYKAEAEFAEYWVTDVMGESVSEMIFHAVDWQSVWDHQLSYDFNTIEFDGETFFFSNNY